MPKVPKYSLHKGTGQARVTIDGKDHYLGLYDSEESKSRYRDLIARWQSRNASVDFPQMSVGQLTMAYMGHAATYYVKHGKKTSEIDGLRTAVRWANRLFSKVQIRDFSPHKLRAVRDRFLENGNNRRTANAHTHRIVRIFRWAVGQELVAPSVLTALEAVESLKKGRTTAREPEPVLPVDESRVAATLPYLPDNARALVLLQQATGARPGELVIMRLCDITMTGGVWEYRPDSHKTEHHGKRRVIPIGPKGQAIVRSRMTTDLTAYLFSRFPKRPYRTGSLRIAICRACEKAFGMPEHLRKSKHNPEADAWRSEHVWHAHQLRHSFATLARKEGGIEVSRTVLGHSQTATTEIYAERDLEAAKALVARIG